MTAKQRILALRLSQKIAKNPDYAKKIGIEVYISNSSKATPNTEDFNTPNKYG